MIAKPDLYTFMRACELCVLSTVSPSGDPQAALVNIAVTPALELIFHTIETNRKCINLRRNPKIAAVIGWEDEQTVQYEGVAEELFEARLSDCKKIYLERFPDRGGRLAWPGLTFFRVRPAWLRYSSYGHPWKVEELTFPG
jgi:pyridoxine/pyridoxamine 5'-phosphate oxidase